MIVSLGLAQIKYQHEILRLPASLHQVAGPASVVQMFSLFCRGPVLVYGIWGYYSVVIYICGCIIICYYFIIFYPVSCGLYIVYNLPAVGNCSPRCRAPKIKDFGKGGRTEQS